MFFKPNCASYKAPVSSPATSSASNVSTVAEHTTCIIDGQSSTEDSYQKYDLIEEVLGGTVFMVPSGVMAPINSPYVTIHVYNSLTQNSGWFQARGFADMVSSATFCPASLARKFKANVKTVPGRRYNFRNASANQLQVVGESVLSVQLPHENRR